MNTLAEKVGTGLGVAAAAAALVWTIAEIQLDEAEQTALAAAGRAVAQITLAIGSSDGPSGFLGEAERRADVHAARGELLGAEPAARAEQEVARRLDALAERMAAFPDAEDGVDPSLRELMVGDPEAWASLVLEQNRLVDVAEGLGGRSTNVLWAIALAAISGAFSTIAPLFQDGRLAVVSLVLSALAIGASLVAGLRGLLA